MRQYIWVKRGGEDKTWGHKGIPLIIIAGKGKGFDTKGKSPRGPILDNSDASLERETRRHTYGTQMTKEASGLG